MKLPGTSRRIVYVALYEAIAIALSSWFLAVFSGHGLHQTWLPAVSASLVAVTWNYVFNTLFERWEARQRVKGRSVLRRVVHAFGFEGGLIVFLVPLFAWLLRLSLWAAFVMELGLLVFFLVYTLFFTWCFDRIFGLPQSARSQAAQASTSAYATTAQA